MADWPPSLKPIGKYLARAKEVQNVNPLVSYYCRYYSLLRAIELRDTSDNKANNFVTNLLEKCEAEKTAIGYDDGSHRGQVEEFALEQFYKADEQDRAGNATRATATTFYASMCFLEVCSVFGSLPADLEEKLRYAKWKAADIIKALREGRKPEPGAPGEAESERQRLAEQQQQQPQEQPEQQEEQREEQQEEQQEEPEQPNQDEERATNLQTAEQLFYPRTAADAPVPPAPPMRDYDSDAYNQPYPAHLASGYKGLPDVAPPYPTSEEPSPLPTRDESSPLYPSFPTASTPTDPYATREEQKPSTPEVAAPPIPSLALPGQEAQRFPKRIAAYRAPANVANAAREINNAPIGAVRRERRAELTVPQRPAPTTPGTASGTPVEVRATGVEVQSREVSMTREVKVKKAYKPRIEDTQEAQRLCRYASSALDFQDFKTAVANLERALKLLTGS
ncbi:hypothetical protein BWQ96_08665 [Gracilariopsis chorda]|uniref:Vacuolar protein sorting-associated protein VTA1-like n=1 Tax=Gracilariopsis chorda TaxID=448386 RepID=A0A2V3IHT3_9FLOR|nr:hypothetical protein BWQ96_08665 [Gracilariopsis chorda]|eukprot:PXF41654.1 hypothetical protein BWQ96_08665 [Gracilariopsis chorda]